jgi:hypothetical protein
MVSIVSAHLSADKILARVNSGDDSLTVSSKTHLYNAMGVVVQ